MPLRTLGGRTVLVRSSVPIPTPLDGEARRARIEKLRGRLDAVVALLADPLGDDLVVDELAGTIVATVRELRHLDAPDPKWERVVAVWKCLDNEERELSR